MLKVFEKNLEGVLVDKKEMEQAIDEPFKILKSVIFNGLNVLYQRGKELGIDNDNIYEEAYSVIEDTFFKLTNDLWKQNMEEVKAQTLIREMEKTNLGRFCLKRALKNIKA